METATSSANRARFTWRCSAFNSIFYDVLEPNGDRYEVELRRRLSDYEASIHNGGAEAYRRDCGPLVGMLRANWRMVSPETLRDFNAWCAEEHAEALAQLRAAPERYGPESDWRETVGDAVQARGVAYYDGATGWRFAA